MMNNRKTFPAKATAKKGEMFAKCSINKVCRAIERPCSW